MVANLNVLREVFEKLSVIPGLIQKLEATLPPEYQAKLAATETKLSPIETALRVEQGALRFENLIVQTDGFQLNAAGAVGLEGSITMRAMLRMDPVLSAAFIQRVKELQYLANASGELEIPLALQGQAPRVVVIPDVNYVAQRLLETKGQELLTNLLQRALEKHLPKESSSESPTP